MQPETDNPYPIGTVCRIRSNVMQPGACRIGEVTSHYQPIDDTDGRTLWGYEIDIYGLAPPASGLPWVARHSQLTPLVPPDTLSVDKRSATTKKDRAPA